MLIFSYSCIVIVTVAAAMYVVFCRNTFNAAMGLITVMCAIAANFLLMHAELIALIQLMVYAGAIMVLFLFVIMLLNIRQNEVTPPKMARRKPAAFILAGMFVIQALIIGVAFFGMTAVPGEPVVLSEQFLDSEQVRQQATGLNTLASVMFTKYLIPFELTGVLLLVAIVGAVATGMKDERPLEAVRRDEI